MHACIRFRRKAIIVLVSGVILASLTMTSGCKTPGKHGGPVGARRPADGTYRGRSRYGPVRVTTDVTIEDGAISDIELVRHFYGRGRKSEGPVIERILSTQSTRVDAVTGATGSSIAIMNAVEDAVVKATQQCGKE